jgi:hypothetical protein
MLRKKDLLPNRILVECELPTDYGLRRSMEYEGLPSIDGNLFYVITKDSRIVIREYLEDGFSFEDKPVDGEHEFTIKGEAQGGMGLWEVTYRVITDSGKVKKIYELNAIIRDMY